MHKPETSSIEAVCAQTPYNLAALPIDDEGATQPLLLQLDIYEEAIFRTTYRDGRPVATDELHPFDIAACLAGLETGTGILPQRVLFCRQAGPDYHLGVYLPPEVRTLRVKGSGEFTLPLPPLVFAGQGRDYHLYALDADGWPAPGDPLYQAPLPNVHTGGLICRGDVAFPPCAPHTIHRAVDLFFESHFSQHLRNNKSRAHPNNVLALWRTLADAYPLDDLIPLDRRLEDLAR